jgi:hypothetical protein
MAGAAHQIILRGKESVVSDKTAAMVEYRDGF